MHADGGIAQGYLEGRRASEAAVFLHLQIFRACSDEAAELCLELVRQVSAARHSLHALHDLSHDCLVGATQRGEAVCRSRLHVGRSGAAGGLLVVGLV